ncbi:hypothetical protein BH23GEM6_BH23GEM6_24720 [soil metagenome]
MYIPKLLLATVLGVVLLLAGWSAALATDRNPLPFPDRNYTVFTTSSPEAKATLIDLLGQHGYRPRFRLDTEGVERAIFWNGTIVNYTHPELFDRLGRPPAAIGLVVEDPVASALDAVRHLRGRGFEATMIEDAEPGLPIVFVTTDALNSSVIVFRKHVLKMGTRPPAWQ